MRDRHLPATRYNRPIRLRDTSAFIPDATGSTSLTAVNLLRLTSPALPMPLPTTSRSPSQSERCSPEPSIPGKMIPPSSPSEISDFLTTIASLLFDPATHRSSVLAPPEAHISFQHILRLLNTNVDGRRKIMVSFAQLRQFGR